MLHAPLDTIVLTVFVHSVLCRITCTVDQACVFLVFVHTVLSSVACNVGHTGVFRVFFGKYVLCSITCTVFCVFVHYI